MYLWGKTSRITGKVAGKGLVDPASVTRADLDEAFRMVETAKACAEQIIEVTPHEGHLLPTKFDDMTPEDQAEFLEKYKALAREFFDTLSTMGSVCENLLTTPSREDFAKLRDLEKALNEIGNRAHGGL
jgi:hypothetical protein